MAFLDRIPPINAQAEQALLGALLTNNRTYDHVAEFLRPHHFADPVHERIYGSIARLIDGNRLADAVTLVAEFDNSGLLEELGGRQYFATLLGAMVSPRMAGEYGRAVHDAWLRRELIDAAETLLDAAFAPGEATATEILEEHESSLLRIAEGAGDVTPTTPAGEAVGQALAITQAASKRESPLAGITTGYAALDRMTAGLQPGKMMLLGARPSMGKTALGLGIATRVAAAGHRVLFWSGEMAADQLGARMAAAHANLSTVSVFTGRGYDTPDDAARATARPLGEREWAALMASERAAHVLPLDIDSRPGITVAALRARARRIKRARGLDLLVIDYASLMRGSADAERRGAYEKMTEISRDLMQLKMELKIPIIVLAQLNRAVESREDKAPQMSDLRDSGALEQDADLVIFLHRQHYYLSRNGAPQRRQNELETTYDGRVSEWHTQMAATHGQATITIAKNRQGPTGQCRLGFSDSTTWFRDIDEDRGSAAWKSTMQETN